MVDSLLLTAKLESGKFLFNPVPTDLYQLGQMVSRDFELIAGAYSVQLQVQLPEPERTILIDETILRRVIDNLLTNAFKFSPAEGTIQLSLEYLPEGRCRIQVADQGPGISKAQEQEIFRKFEIGTFKKKINQIGLGLTFCKMAVEAQGGSLLLGSNYPQGSIFTVIV
jgi:signal transduction histidine kinase